MSNEVDVIGWEAKVHQTTGRIVATFPWTVGMKHGSTTKGTSKSRRTWSGYQKLFSSSIKFTWTGWSGRTNFFWGDFCKPKYHWNEVKEEYEKYLDLNMTGFDHTDPTTVVTPTPKTVIPEPEKHVSFTTILMVMAVELYQKESERKFCHYVTYAHQKLVNFVESRKQMTTESYKFFIEHAYNQFVTHSAFHTSARAKTKAKDITAHGITHVSTKLSGYAWIGSKTKLVHLPEDQAGDVTMDDVAEDDTDRRANVLPRLEVKIEREDEQEPQQVEDVQEEVQQEPMEGAGSPQGEETQEEPGDSGQAERLESPPGNSPQERYGNYIMSQFSVQEFNQLRDWVFNLTSGFSEQERREQRLPLTPDDVSTMAISMFMEVLAIETHQGFMSSDPHMTRTEVDPDTFHSIQLSCKRVKKENENITFDSFEEEEDNPEIPEDPENKKEIEHMTRENKHIILETDDSVLIDCTVQWMNMLNEDLQKRILERVSFVKKEVEDEQDEEEEEEKEEEEEVKKEPEVPPTTKVSISTQTDLPDEAPQSGSSQQRKVPASTASSHQREEAKEWKSINDDDTAPPFKKTATLVWYGQDISGNEEDSILRELSKCFSDGYQLSFNLGRFLQPRISSIPKQQAYALAQEV